MNQRIQTRKFQQYNMLHPGIKAFFFHLQWSKAGSGDTFTEETAPLSTSKHLRASRSRQASYRKGKSVGTQTNSAIPT